MLCKHPTSFRRVSNKAPFPCRQCDACRINARNIWGHRMVLESQLHDDCSFLTCTYNDENLPDEFVHPDTGQVYAPLSVNPEHHRLFINNFRTSYFRHTGKKIRMFGVGEYGEKSQRPHYHYALFGYRSCPYRGGTVIGNKFQPCQCPDCSFIANIWNKGNILLGSLTHESANYVAGYVTKKMTKSQCNCFKQGGDTHHPKCPVFWLDGRYPEFARMSRMPGIGAGAVDKIASLLTRHNIQSHDAVPGVLLHGSKLLPLGRYLTDKIYDQLGITFEPKERLKRFESAVHDMLFDPQNSTPEVRNAAHSSVQIALQMLNAQKIVNLEKRVQLYNKGKVL